MPIEIAPLSDTGIGAEVRGVDFSATVDAETAETLNAALLQHVVLCLRTGGLDAAGFRDTARIFGTPKVQLRRKDRDNDVHEVSYIWSEQKDDLGTGKHFVSGSHWHTDDSYLQVPCSLTMLHAKVLPESGGDTRFANMRAAYAALPDGLREKISGRFAIHKYLSRRNVAHVPQRTAEEEAESRPARHPLVRTHPDTGTKALYLNPNRIDHIEGMEIGEGDRLLDDLLAHATQPQFIYRHKWQMGDIVVWDNRCSMHRATDDYRGQARRMMRILIEGSVPV